MVFFMKRFVIQDRKNFIITQFPMSQAGSVSLSKNIQKLSTVNCQLSTVNRQPPTANSPLPTVSPAANSVKPDNFAALWKLPVTIGKPFYCKKLHRLQHSSM